jgi:hypothetical protein
MTICVGLTSDVLTTQSVPSMIAFAFRAMTLSQT